MSELRVPTKSLRATPSLDSSALVTGTLHAAPQLPVDFLSSTPRFSTSITSKFILPDSIHPVTSRGLWMCNSDTIAAFDQ